MATTEIQVKEELAVAVTELGSKLGEYDTAIKANAQIGDDLRGELKGVEERVGKLHDILMEMQKEAGRLDTEAAKAEMSLGEIVTSSEEYKNFKIGSRKESGNIAVPGGFRQFMRKDLTTVTGGAGILPHRDPRFVDLRFNELTLRDLISSFPIGSNSVEFVKETGFNQLYSESTASAAAAQAIIAVDNVNGYYVGQTVTVEPGVANAETKVIKAAGITITNSETSAGTLEFTTNLAHLHPAGTAVVSDTFVATPEAKLKPRADITIGAETSIVKTLAHWLAATRQILADESGLQAHVNMRLAQGLKLVEEKQILYGDGTGNQLQGIMTDSDTGTYSWSSGIVGDTKLDAIRRAITLSMLAHFPPTGVVIHPTDWEAIETVKGTDGHYIWAAVPGGGVTPMVWRVPVVLSTAIESGDALIGAFALGVTIWDREESNIRISESHDDYFVRNMVAILAEERLAMTLNRPESFVALDFDSAPV